MAIRHSITLSTSEPHNEVGNLKIRQGDEQTQTLVANITENGVPKPFTGLQPFFCAKLGQTAGLGIIEQKVTGAMNPANGTLEYVMQPEDWQQLGRQTAYFSFRKMVNDHEWTEQFSTRDFNYNVTKSAFSEGVKETKKDGSTYIWTIEDMLRLFKEYIATGKVEWENYKNDERTIWETYRLAEKINWDDYKLREKNEWQNYKADEKTTWEKFVEDNREFLENADPGGKIILELLGARGGAYQTLGERLDSEKAESLAKANEFETEIAKLNVDKANERDVRLRAIKLNQNDMTDDFLQQIAGGAPINATPAKGSITRERLTQKVVGDGQTDFLTRGKNLFDKDNLIAGYAINASGELFSSPAFYVSDFINVSPNTTYRANNSVILALYDKSFAFVSRPLNNTSGVFLTPQNVFYTRVAVSSGIRANLQIEKGEASTPREDYSISMDKLKLKENNFEDRIIKTESLKSLETGKNLFDHEKATQVGLIDMQNGIINTTATTARVSDFIPVKQNEFYSRSHAGNFAFYDENKIFLPVTVGNSTGEYNSSLKTFEAPDNAHCIRLNLNASVLEIFQFEQNASPTDFEPYGYRLKELLYDNDISLLEDQINNLEDQINNLEVVSPKQTKYPSPAFVEPDIALIGGNSYSVAFVDSENNLWAVRWDNKIYKNPVNTTSFSLVLDATPFLQDGETISGYALVVSDAGLIIVATNKGRVLVSDTDKTSLTEAFTFKAGYTQNTWGFDKQGQYILMASYGGKTSARPPREVYLSKNHGETWELIFDKPIGDMINSNDYHMHDVAFDPYSNAIIVVQGDTVNNQIYYSYDFGNTWKKVNPDGASKIHPTSILCFPEGIAFGSDEIPEGISWWDRPADETEPDIKHDDIYWKKKFNLGETIIGNIAVKGATLFDESGLYGVIGFINHNTSAPGYSRLFATGDGGRSWHQIWKSDNQIDESGFFNALLRKTNTGIEIYSRYSVGGQPHMFKAEFPQFYRSM